MKVELLTPPPAPPPEIRITLSNKEADCLGVLLANVIRDKKTIASRVMHDSIEESTRAADFFNELYNQIVGGGLK